MVANALGDRIDFLVALGGHDAPEQHVVLEALLLSAARLGHVEPVGDPVDDVGVQGCSCRFLVEDERFELVLRTRRAS